MYGDHYGISSSHKKAMEQVLDTEYSDFLDTSLQRVPLFIRVPGMEGGTNHEYSGQIDLKPTLLHLLGIDSKEYIHFGTDIFSKEHDDLIPFRNGDFVSPTITAIGGKYYDSNTGELIEDEEVIAKGDEMNENVEQKLAYSDKVVNADLLRFYEPENFTPVNRSDYDYADFKKLFTDTESSTNSNDMIRE